MYGASYLRERMLGAYASGKGTLGFRIIKFMNSFRKLGYISYNSRIHIHEALSSAGPRRTWLVLVDHEQTAAHRKRRAKTV